MLIELVLSAILVHDDGRYADSPLRGWFNSLTNQNAIPCCSTSDGRRVEDADWDTKDNHYRVRVDGVWYDVPDEAVIKTPNRAGMAVVWPFVGPDGQVHIRCFLSGSGT